MTPSGSALALPVVFDASVAHQSGQVRYRDDGTVECTHPAVARPDASPLLVPPDRQYPTIRSTFDDLNKSLSRLATSPLLADGRTLRQAYEAEAEAYENAAATAWSEGRWEPDYGSYVLDPVRGELFLVAPERWHRLALVTSNARLIADPEMRLSWGEIRRRLESSVVGFAGCSVGSAILGGYLRETRPAQVKIADPDWVEATNLNRMERMGLAHLGRSRSARFDPRNPYDVQRVPKVEAVAREMLLVDPYTRFHLYGDGLDRANLDRFLLGDGEEPGIDVLVEEMDDLEMKVAVRQRCRELGIDVVMATDFGHRVHVMWNYFKEDPQSPIGFGADDATLMTLMEGHRGAGRQRFFSLVDALCGPGQAGPQFEAWFAGVGEQPTASVPQSGGTTIAAGGIVGKEVALHLLGHHALPSPRVVVYDLLGRAAWRP